MMTKKVAYKIGHHKSPNRFEVSQNSVKSTVLSEIDQIRYKIGQGW